MDTITVKLVRGVGGNIDQDLSRSAFDMLLAQHIAARETEYETIGAAVDSVFDQYVGASINMSALVSFALTKLNAQPENYAVLSERVAQYVRDNSQGKLLSEKGAEVKVWERPDSTFVIGKGKGGGVYRRIDHVEKPSAK